MGPRLSEICNRRFARVFSLLPVSNKWRAAFSDEFRCKSTCRRPGVDVPRSRFTEFIAPGLGFRVQQTGSKTDGFHLILLCSNFGFELFWYFNLALQHDSTRTARCAYLFCKLPQSKRQGVFATWNSLEMRSLPLRRRPSIQNGTMSHEYILKNCSFGLRSDSYWSQILSIQSSALFTEFDYTFLVTTMGRP